MARIKVTGYINPGDLDPAHIDLEHASGLTEDGFLDLVMGENGNALKLSDLEDTETEWAND